MAEPKAKKPRGKQPPPESDKPPRKQKSGGAKAAERKARDIGLIEQGFAELLVMPAMAAGLAGDQWAADHFANRGPQLAKRLAAECERNAALRKWCLRALQGQSVMLLGVEVFMYAAPVAMHYGLIPGAEALGVPVVKRKSKPQPEAPVPGSQPPFVRHPDGRVTRRDGAPLSPEEEAMIFEATAPQANGEPPEFEAEPPAAEDAPPIDFA